jgi:predicted regulator of amino acid metabolism with ACT domain
MPSPPILESTRQNYRVLPARQQICQARALVSYLAVRELMISGADVARRMNIDRSTVSRAVGRVQADPALKNMSKALRHHLHSEG